MKEKEEKKEPKGVFIRLSQEERKKWKLKCAKLGISYKDSVMLWITGVAK